MDIFLSFAAGALLSSLITKKVCGYINMVRFDNMMKAEIIDMDRLIAVRNIIDKIKDKPEARA